ncbi:unnamed protein product [Larinioides sclopetarius]|uniref:50S ribosomal protein L34 n=1 Tax=Larinioides sclopetarius TaxID=280406 RepID=A0AAV1ZS40_9ARAC
MVASRGCHGYGTVPPRQYKVIKSRRRKKSHRKAKHTMKTLYSGK